MGLFRRLRREQLYRLFKINSILAALIVKINVCLAPLINNGLHHAAYDGHETHFHIDLRSPRFKGLPQQLMVSDVATEQVPLTPDTGLVLQVQAVLDQIRSDSDLNLKEGEVTMLVPDMPSVSPHNVPIVIAQASQAVDGKAMRTVGVCTPVPNAPANYSLENVIGPKVAAISYFFTYEHKNFANTVPATITLLQQPKHGILRLVTEADRGTLFGSTADPLDPAAGLYGYLPENGYAGKDKAVFLVEMAGVKIKVIYFFQAVSGGLGSSWIKRYCGKTGYQWKISTALDTSGNSTITAVDYQGPEVDGSGVVGDFSSWLSSAHLDTNLADASNVTVKLADLPGSSVGSTEGFTITLDTTAAGYNWFIDPTPTDNAEFLPTSNPNEWIAKAGSAAAGKMDMLSVLLHEYGHALGIDHSANPNDFMGTTLSPGVRRLPTAEELTLMAQLVGEAKAGLDGSGSPDTPDAPNPTLPLGGGIGIALLGRLRRSSFGSLVTTYDSVFVEPQVAQYAVAANPTLTDAKRQSSTY